MSKKVFVGLSGGVDSAVSAALLKSSGHDVVGVFIKIWQPEFIECTWKEDRLDAMRVAAALSIPFREIDLSEEYKKEVVVDMLENYARGVTPNPDVVCNQYIKFGAFLDWALSEGADILATGHYARVGKDERGYTLLRGKDSNKDQSYFLWKLEQNTLQHIMFPLGEYKKPEVRALAKRYRLPNAERPDSQGLCFVGDVSVGEFLARFLTTKEGCVRDMDGRDIGRHKGAILYTIGQRHGFEVQGEENTPHYVIGLDVRKNEIIVSKRKEDAARKELRIKSIHWIVPKEIPFSCTAQVRYRDKALSCAIRTEGDSFVAEFEIPIIASPGQSLVLYDGDMCLGGGIIDIL